jgi:hypothetical protein
MTELLGLVKEENGDINPGVRFWNCRVPEAGKKIRQENVGQENKKETGDRRQKTEDRRQGEIFVLPDI